MGSKDDDSEEEVIKIRGSSTRPNAVISASEKSPITPNTKKSLNAKEKSVKTDKSSSIGKRNTRGTKRVIDDDDDDEEEESSEEVISKRTSTRRSQKTSEFIVKNEKSPEKPMKANRR